MDEDNEEDAGIAKEMANLWKTLRHLCKYEIYIMNFDYICKHYISSFILCYDYKPDILE